MGISTRDTTSGFDWLDVTETLDLSYDEVVVGPFYAAGWAHATVPQWCDFVAGLGATSGWVIFTGSSGGPFPSQCGADPPPGTANGAFINFDDQAFGVDWPLLQSQFGITDSDGFRTFGVLDYGPDGDPLDRMGANVHVPLGRFHDLQLVNNLDDRFLLATSLSGVSTSSGSENVGHFLIRVIPEPSTALLLASGLVAIGVWRRRWV